MNPHTHLLFLLFLFLALMSVVPAQKRSPDRGIKANSPFASQELDSVNLTNGNVFISIPLASLPKGRGDSPDFPISLNYNSKLWDMRRELRFDGLPDENGNTKYLSELLVPAESGGWTIGLGYRLILRSRLDLEPFVPCDGSIDMIRNAYAFKLELRFPDGTEREFKPVGFRDAVGDGYFNVTPNGVINQWNYSTVGPGSASCSMTFSRTTGDVSYYTTDGSHLRLTVHRREGNTSGADNSWTLYYPNGTMVENLPADAPAISQRMTDRNGNHAYLKRGVFNGAEASIVEDDMGRQTILQSTATGQSVFKRGFNGELLETRIEWTPMYLRKHYNSAHVQALNAPLEARNRELYQQLGVVSRIVLPHQVGGLHYEFGYQLSSEPTPTVDTDGWGELTTMLLPTGAEVRYRYLLDEIIPISASGDVVRNPVTKRILNFTEEADGKTRAVSETRSYAVGPDSSIFTDADGHSTYTSFVGADSGSCDAGLVLFTRYPDGSITENLWANRCSNPYVQFKFTTLADSVGVPKLTSAVQTTQDQNGNVLEEKHYGYATYSSVYRVNDRPTGISPDMRLEKSRTNEFYDPTRVANGWSSPATPRLRNALKSTELRDGEGRTVSREEYGYDDPSTRGNVISVRRWDSTKGPVGPPDLAGMRLNDTNSISSKTAYDRFGNPILMTDARGFETEIEYGADAGAEGLYPTRRTEAVRTSVALTSSAAYDISTGLVVGATKFGNSSQENISSKFTYDASGRLLSKEESIGTSAHRSTVFEYDDRRRVVVMRSDRDALGDGKDVSVDHYDQLGRLRLHRKLDSSAEDVFDEKVGTKIQTRYLVADGSVYKLVSNPYRSQTSEGSGEDAAMGWRRERSDRSVGISERQLFTGADLPAPWGSNTSSRGKAIDRGDADLTMLTDESGRRRIVRRDAAGDVSETWEIGQSGDETVEFGSESFSGFRTSFLHDAAGHLIGVTQGVQRRMFNYDSLSRLRTVSNPESGTVNYDYDANGNISGETDARGVSTRYAYDALNRMVNRSFTTDSLPGYMPSPNVTYSYDDYRVPFSKGKLTRVHSEVTDDKTLRFDAAGRITASEQVTDDTPYRVSYEFNLAGDLLEQKYPSGRTVRNSLGSDGLLHRVESATARHAFRIFASNFAYDASESLTNVRLGNGLWEHSSFSARGGMQRVSLGRTTSTSDLADIVMSYSTSGDDGNVRTISIGALGAAPRTQSFSYDEFDRLVTSVETSRSSLLWRQVFKYDRFGNRRFDENATTTLPRNCLAGFVQTVCSVDRKRLNPLFSITDNRLLRDQDSDGVEDFRIDASGNILEDPSGLSFFYDSNNRQVQVEGPLQNLVSRYAYDGHGRRVKKTVFVNNAPTETTVFVYDAFGKAVAEYSNKSEPSSSARVNYIFADHLGSVRAVSDQFGKIVSRHDYFPFGGEIQRSMRGGDSVRIRFAANPRDQEVPLDQAGARYYSFDLGRFTSPDPLLSSMDISRPQSLNRYSYVMNNPLRYIDPTGEDWVLNTGGDRAKNPYLWVDKCAAGQGCWASVAHDTGSGVRIYGTLGPKDVTWYSANDDGQMNMETLLTHHDSKVTSAALSQGIPEPYLSTKAATSIFNLGIRYHGQFPKDGNLVFTNGNNADGKPCVYANGRSCHSGHKGSDMDLRYMDATGRSLFGASAYLAADPKRIKFILEFMKGRGFPESFSGDSNRLGTNPASRGTARLHRNHLHVGVID